MALKLTRTASETLNDIILHTLQEQGLEKAEALEQEIFSQLEQLPTTTSEQDDNIDTVVVGGAFAIVYKQSGNDYIVLTIAHTSRLAKVINS